MVQIKINKKSASQKERAIVRGELTVEIIESKIVSTGYPSLRAYEQEFYKEHLARILKKDLSDVTEDDVLYQCKVAKAVHFKLHCDEQIVRGFTASNGHFYRTNRDDQTNLIGRKDDLDDVPSETVLWKTEDVGYVVHTEAEWRKIYREAFRHKKEKLLRYDVSKAYCLAATSHDELMAIEWDKVEIPDF